MTVSAAIRRMLAAGFTIEQALVAAEAFEAEAAPQEPVLSKRQARNRRYYERLKSSEKRLNADDQDVSDASDEPSSPEGSSPTPPSPKPQSSIPPSPPKGGSSPTAVDQVVTAFSEMARQSGLSVPRAVTASRRRSLLLRIEEHGLPAVLDAIERIGRSRFCRGENDRGWRADLDFFCQPKSFVSILEGKYDDRPLQQSQAPPRESEHARHQRECREAIQRKLNGNGHDEFASTGPAFDLEPGDFRAH
ncbi:DNA replication protein [Sinorhizobium meliloti]|uniref:DNA replication protein n=1 Tax=Rhizobium meliloti TaxID=382 RepID=UPI000B4A3129|nr:DNA replication protein [Sinorhizobium meliloti]ASP84297.1 DNA replication protein [Sinorhizobium meliloti]MQW29220.1 DNA replication protein [Sinorhizobium meliloti]